MKTVSIVIPVFNEEESLPELFQRLDIQFQILDQLFDFEVILVNDGSTDSSFNLIQSKIMIDDRYKLISLSRNFGHQAALIAGLNRAKGDSVIVMDADLQDPPELIPELIRVWTEGADVVYAQRRHRSGESWFKKATASMFYRLLDSLSDTSLPRNVGDFRLIDKRVVKLLIEMTEKSIYLRGLISWIGFTQSSVLYDRDPRFAGDTKYSLRKMIDLSMDAIISFSERPLRLVTRLGLFVTTLSFLTVSFFLATTPFEFGPRAPGWLSIILAILILGGVQLVCLGIVGEYISKIYRESKNRPIYIIDDYRSSDHD
jgi:glycosyltransferase involved in cell wall biosynthesis